LVLLMDSKMSNWSF